MSVRLLPEPIASPATATPPTRSAPIRLRCSRANTTCRSILPRQFPPLISRSLPANKSPSKNDLPPRSLRSRAFASLRTFMRRTPRSMSHRIATLRPSSPNAASRARLTPNHSRHLPPRNIPFLLSESPHSQASLSSRERHGFRTGVLLVLVHRPSLIQVVGVDQLEYRMVHVQVIRFQVGRTNKVERERACCGIVRRGHRWLISRMTIVRQLQCVAVQVVHRNHVHRSSAFDHLKSLENRISVRCHFNIRG